MRRWNLLILAAVVTVPGLILKFTLGKDLITNAALVGAFAWGLAVVGAAFLLTWACEAAQKDVPPAFAISILALIAIAPEYSVDWALTFEAGTNPEYKEYAIANMIGANRMIVGFAWPLLVFIFWLKFRKAHITLGKSHRVEIGFLLAAGLYSIILPIKGYIDIIDVIILVSLFGLYTLRLLKGQVEEPHLVGPAKMVGELPKNQRRLVVLGLMGFSLFTILQVAKPFAQSLIYTGEQIGVDSLFLVKWFAPLASEAPEIVVCVIFTLRAMAAEGLGTLVSSKVNQWTLLVGTLPLVYSLGAGQLKALPLSGTLESQGAEFDLVGPMLVTSAQTLLAVMIVLNLRVSLLGAGTLFGLLLVQFFFPGSVAGIKTDYIFTALYGSIALFLAVRERLHFIQTIKSMFSPRYVREQESAASITGAEDNEQATHAVMRIVNAEKSHS
ncbi:MAG TPA: sodium:calcium antiporter [Chloroflexia bacterium]|nr:sodium:calcium antiporter [Chloroflexia bacterium]